MRWIDRLNSKFGRYGIPNLTVLLIAGQVLVFVAGSTPLAQGGGNLLDSIRLQPDKVMQGEWWRLITYLFDAPFTPIFIFVLLFWYFLYMMGSTLEYTWGAFRYNLYLLLGYLASITMTFVAYFSGAPAEQAASNGFLYGTVFLAFARLYPDFVIYMFFVLPVKIRWLAILTWISYGWTMVASPYWIDRAMVVAAVFNYLVFFGRDILSDIRQGHRRMSYQARSLQGKGVTRQRMAHQCRVCGLSSADSPRTQFRYCSECGGNVCYCPDHIGNHEHVQAEPVPAQEPAK